MQVAFLCWAIPSSSAREPLGRASRACWWGAEPQHRAPCRGRGEGSDQQRQEDEVAALRRSRARRVPRGSGRPAAKRDRGARRECGNVRRRRIRWLERCTDRHRQRREGRAAIARSRVRVTVVFVVGTARGGVGSVVVRRAGGFVVLASPRSLVGGAKARPSALDGARKRGRHRKRHGQPNESLVCSGLHGLVPDPKAIPAPESSSGSSAYRPSPNSQEWECRPGLAPKCNSASRGSV